MLHTSAVTFCHSAVEQLIDHHSKAAVVNGIEQLLGDKIDAKASQRFVRTPRDVSVLRNPHVLQLAVKGAQRHWMYLTRLQHQNVCLLIERFIRPGYPFPKMLLVAFQFNEVLHQNTLLEVEVMNSAGGVDTPLLLVADIAALKNRVVTDWDPLKRHNVIHTIFEKQFTENLALQPCALQIKRLYAPHQWGEMMELVAKLPYSVRGLVFLPLNTNFSKRVWMDDREELQAYARGPARRGGDGCAASAHALGTVIDTNTTWDGHGHGRGRGGVRGGKSRGGGKGRGKGGDGRRGERGRGKGKGKGHGGSACGRFEPGGAPYSHQGPPVQKYVHTAVPAQPLVHPALPVSSPRVPPGPPHDSPTLFTLYDGTCSTHHTTAAAPVYFPPVPPSLHPVASSASSEPPVPALDRIDS